VEREAFSRSRVVSDKWGGDWPAAASYG
jgi:hypothetical protein